MTELASHVWLCKTCDIEFEAWSQEQAEEIHDLVTDDRHEPNMEGI